VARIPPATRDDVPDGEKDAYDEFMRAEAAGPTWAVLAPPAHAGAGLKRLEALRTYRPGEDLPQKLRFS